MTTGTGAKALRRYALAGHPIDRSPSPAMHNAAFAALGLDDAEYTLRSATAGEEAAVLRECRGGVWEGLNVTTPLKTRMAALVTCDALATRARSVNTLYREQDDELRGTTTDVEGVSQPLRALGLGGKPGGVALLIGAGGAARPAAIALADLGLRVVVAARRIEQARELTQQVFADAGLARRGACVALDDADLMATVVASADVVVQATPLGTDAKSSPPLPWHCAKSAGRLVAFDMVYTPRQTPFLRAAAGIGALTIEGWQMLVAQGARSFELWTGMTAPFEVMRDAVLNHLAQLQQAAAR